MFPDLPAPPATSAEWKSASFEDRLAQLRRGELRVAYYYDNPDSGTFRYRVYNMIEVIEAFGSASSRPSMSAAWFCRRDGDSLERVVEHADILVLCRARYSDRLGGLVTRARNLGRQVVYDVDDLVIDIDHTHLLAYSLDQDMHDEAMWNEWFGYVGRLSTLMRLCERVIVTNDYLAARVAECSGKPVSVIPNFMNRAQLAYSDRLFEAKHARRFAREAHLHIGYFSGSPSHNRDFEIASPALGRLMANDPRIRLRVVGILEVKGPAAQYAERIERLPFQDYIRLQQLIASTEINLAPLQDNMFTNCKSELKYFEAAAAGTLTVASPTFVFAEAIDDGENGWLSANHQWDDKIAEAIAALDDGAQAYERMAVAARDHAKRLFAWDKQYEAIRDVLLCPGESRPATNGDRGRPAMIGVAS